MIKKPIHVCCFDPKRIEISPIEIKSGDYSGLTDYTITLVNRNGISLPMGLNASSTLEDDLVISWITEEALDVDSSLVVRVSLEGRLMSTKTFSPEWTYGQFNTLF